MAEYNSDEGTKLILKKNNLKLINFVVLIDKCSQGIEKLFFILITL